MTNSGIRIGYIRVSTVDQHTDRQLAGLELDKVFEDKASGKNTGDRPELLRMIDYVREGDDLFVHSMDRLARNLNDLLQLVQQLNDKGVTVHFVKEGLVFDPNKATSPMSKLMLSVMGAVSEFERSLILERQREGIALAKARGAYAKPRRKKITTDMVMKAKDLLATGMSVTTVAKELGVSRTSVYRSLSTLGIKGGRDVLVQEAQR